MYRQRLKSESLRRASRAGAGHRSGSRGAECRRLAYADASTGLAQIAELGARSLASSADAIAAVTNLVQRTTGIDITVTSQITDDGQYVFRGIEKRPNLPTEHDSAIPYSWSMCSRVHAGESPATVTDTREVPALWQQWLRLKEASGVDWDILAFCTRDIRLPDGLALRNALPPPHRTARLHDRRGGAPRGARAARGSGDLAGAFGPPARRHARCPPRCRTAAGRVGAGATS